jgi:uncharacterized membrane protein YkvA (DUF1232 family)
MARMPLVPFLIYSGIGTVVWVGLLTASGYLLKENYTVVADYLDRVSQIIIGLIVLTYFWRLLAGGRLGERVRGWAGHLRRDVHAVYLAARDPRTPWYAKGAALLVAAYAVSPIDLIPDFIPVLGHLDDAVLVPLGVWLSVRLIPADVLEEHRRSAAEAAEGPRSWWVGAAFIAVQAIVLAFAVRFGIEYFTGG